MHDPSQIKIRLSINSSLIDRLASRPGLYKQCHLAHSIPMCNFPITMETAKVVSISLRSMARFRVTSLSKDRILSSEVS